MTVTVPLSDLQPEFVQCTDRKMVRGALKFGVPMVDEDGVMADGIRFLCPLARCGYGYNLYFFDSAPVDAEPSGRWGTDGERFEDLTLIGPDILCECGWRGRIENGEAVTLKV